MQIVKNKIQEYMVSEEYEGIRLDKCICILDKDISRMSVQRLIDEGNITVNRKNRKTII